MDFQDRHVLVTGGTGALGTAVAGALLASGAICHLPYRHEADAERFPHRGHRNVRLRPAGDLADAASVARVFEDAPGLWASIHIAGGFAFGALAEADPAIVRAQIDMNLMSCLLCCRAAVQTMLRGGNGGRIVNIAARPALEWRDGAMKVAYAAAKAGVAAATEALAQEVAEHGILVNAVAPSIMDTPANRSAMPEADHAAWPKVEEVAATILFLASTDNRVTRGAVVPVYGKS
jgi:NAD(P)-dependent dehydrogenase (short-subunit alcohol dehydrogenase family)